MPSFLTILAGVVTLLAVAIYFFGIPPELKRKMERAALKTMGENKASYLVKGKALRQALPILEKEEPSLLTSYGQIKYPKCLLRTRRMSRT